jgi:hypothetical protein
VTDRVEQRARQAFHDAITRVQVLQYGDDPEVEPGQAAMPVLFDWPGRSEGGKTDPRTVHRFVSYGNQSSTLGPAHARLCATPEGRQAVEG